MSTPRRTLIIRLSSLGDILHTLPAFADLRASFPGERIDWLVADKCAPLLSAVPGIDRVHVFDSKSLLRSKPGHANNPSLRRLVRDLRRARYDLSIDFQGLIKTAALGFLSGARERVGFSRELAREYPAHWFYHRTLAGPEEQVHVLRLNRMLAGLAGSIQVPAPLSFTVPADDARRAESLMKEARLEDFVVVNPGGGWPAKRWSLERYGILAKRIGTELGLQVVVTTGPGEEGYFRTISECCGDHRPEHFPVSFLQLIPLFQKARLVIGGDTGPFHLACALGTPVVGIFGPTSPVRNGPWSGGDEVVARVLPCSDCYRRTCPERGECMDISPDDVFAAAVRRLARTGGS